MPPKPPHQTPPVVPPTLASQPTSDTSPGKSLAGPQVGENIPERLAQYKIVGQLGHGGMGWVLLAEDTQLGRQVVLKVMRAVLGKDPDFRERFFREAKAAAALKHDHIITIYQVGEDQGIPFLAMELLEGATLQRRLDHDKPLPISQILRIGREIAAGLAAAHARGLIHRDIKPANIWLEAPKGRVKILDFGLARQVDAAGGTSQSGLIVGTPHYMPPEQARGEVVDHRSDLFSLGSVLYRMTAGRLPFQGDTLMSTLTALAVDEPPAVAHLNPEAPPALSDLIARLMSKDRAGRPASAQEVVNELTQIQRGLSAGGQSGLGLTLIRKEPSARKLSLPAKAVRKPTHAKPLPVRWLAAGGAALAVLLMAASIGWYVFQRPGKEPAAQVPKQLDMRKVIPLRTSDRSPDRLAVEWAFQHAADNVQVRVTGQQPQSFTRYDSLPSEPFTLLGVKLENSQSVFDPDLVILARLPKLEWLEFAKTSISDAGLNRFDRLPKLTSIRVSGTKVTDDGVRHILRIAPELRYLYIGSTRCTPDLIPDLLQHKRLERLGLESLSFDDSHVRQLQVLTELQFLHLSGTKVTNHCFPELVRYPHLSWLELNATVIDDEGLPDLAKVTGLTYLSLSDTAIGDKGLASLQPLQRLHWLKLVHTRITDESLATLRQFPILARLELSDEHLSAAALEAFRQDRPQCDLRVEHVQPAPP